MKERPPSKHLKVVSSTDMLNFVCWLVANYPDVRNLQSLSEKAQRKLIAEYVRARPDVEKSPDKWLFSINYLFSGDDLYRDAEHVLHTAR